MFKLFNRKMMKTSRLLFFMGTTALCVAAHADETISANVTLDADADWRSKGKVTIEQGVKVNLNGHKLTVSRLVAGKGALLTDLTHPDGAASTSSILSSSSGDIGRLFNDKPTNDEGGRIDIHPSKLPLIVDYDFGEGNEKVVDMYKVYCHPNASLSARGPKTWYFYGSNDGINWTELDARLSETGWSSALECRTKTFENTTAYRYYRIKFTANNGDRDTLQITQLEYFSSLSAGELHWDIPAGTTVDNKNVEITDGVRLVKDGAGTFVASRPNQTYYGGTHVVTGTFKCGAGTLAGELGGRPFVVVEKNGCFDVNGWKNIWNCGVTLAGGTLTNSGYDFGLTDPQISKLKLTADSYVTAPHNLGFSNSGNGVSTLDLGGKTLYISFDQEFRFVNAEAVSSGVINIVGMGDAALLTFANVESRLQEVGLDITGRVSLYSNVKAGDLRLNANTICFNQSSFKCQVYGKLALLNDAYFNIELQDGATLDFSGRTSPLNVVSQLENQQLTFVPDARMTLDLGNCQLKDLGDYKPGKGRKVIEWTETPSDLQARQFKVKENGKDAHMVVTVADDGIYLWSGMMIYFR